VVAIDVALTFHRRGQHPADVEPVLHTRTKEEAIRRLGEAAQQAGLLVPSRSVVLVEDPMSAKLRPCPRLLKFARCDTCCHLHDRITATTDMVEKEALHEEKRYHLENIEARRAFYGVSRELAQTNPHQYMSLVVDSMDSTTTDFHIIGAISHGRRCRAFMFVASRRTNVTIEIVHRVVLATLEAEGALPPVLHLQLDNTADQCKSRWLVGYLSLLVSHGVFEQVTLSYLPVGHTIDEIDQLFSLVAFREID
jgi:hypothetical protein